MLIDTGATYQGQNVDDTQRVVYRDWTRADRKRRQIIEAIQTAETVAEVNAVMDGEEAVLDGLYRFDEAMSLSVAEAAADQRIILRAGQESLLRTTQAPASVASHHQGNQHTMFTIDANIGGSKGPFLRYKNRAGQGLGDGTWYLCERPEGADDWTYTDMTEAFRGGFVADIFATHDGQLGGTLKMGFVKFVEGQAPERQWFASPLKQEQRRDESKNTDGMFVWQNAVEFRIAIGGGRDALCDVTGWSGYKGVMELLQAMNSGFAANIGLCPLVQYKGFRTEGTGKKRLHVPEFTIARWVARPECLKADTPAIAAVAPEPAPQPAPKPQPAPAPAATPADAEF